MTPPDVLDWNRPIVWLSRERLARLRVLLETTLRDTARRASRHVTDKRRRRFGPIGRPSLDSRSRRTCVEIKYQAPNVPATAAARVEAHWLISTQRRT